MGSATPANLREHRLAKGLTQEQLAVHAGVTAKTVREIEKGGAYTPHRGTLLLLSQVLGCTIDDLTEPEDLAA